MQRLRGAVTYRGAQVRPASQGDRLDRVGAGLSTAARSGARLALDSGIGTVQVAASTRLQVQTLATTANGGRVMVLDVPRGQVRLQVRPFTNPSSRLEIRTPSGVAAVRGTEFGVSTDEDGRMAIATLSGRVDAQAQNRSVEVNPGYASIIRPGEPPSPPIALDRALQLQVVSHRRQGRRVSVVGEVNPANTVKIAGVPVAVSRQGRFDATVQLSARQRFVDAVILNPLGEQRKQRIWVEHGD